jgi:hypothetical protein
MSCSQSGCRGLRSIERAQRGRDRLDRGERVVELVAEDAHEALPRLELLLAQRPAEVAEHHQLVRAARPRGRCVRRMPQRPRRAAARRGQDPVGLALEAFSEADLPRVAPEGARPAGRAAAGRRGSRAAGLESASKAKIATSISLMTAERSAVASSAPRLCVWRMSPRPLISARTSPRGSRRFAPARAEREVPLAQRQEQVGHGLQRAHHALAAPRMRTRASTPTTKSAHGRPDVRARGSRPRPRRMRSTTAGSPPSRQ